MGKKKKNDWDLVPQQIKWAQEHVASLNRHKEIMSGKGAGDLTGMSKAQQTMWFKFGQSLTSDNYKRSRAGFTGPMSNEQYDKYVRKGIAAEIAGMHYAVTPQSSGEYVNRQAQKKKKKRIV